MYKSGQMDKYLFLKARCKRAYCTNFSIWSWKCFEPIKLLGKGMESVSSCHPDIFPFMYWAVLIFSFCALILSIHEHFSLYRCKEISTYRNRKYRIIPKTVRRNARLIGSAIMIKANFFLLFGVVTVSPSSMKPWITIQFFVLGFDLLLWLFEIISGDDVFTLSNFLSYFIFLYTFSMVNCVKDVFQNGIEANEIDNLKLFKRII